MIYKDAKLWPFVRRVLRSDVANAIAKMKIIDSRTPWENGSALADINACFYWSGMEYALQRLGLEYFSFMSLHHDLKAKYGDGYDLRKLPPREQPSLFEEEEELHADS